jgi:predicted aspartyl protease
MIQGIVNAKRQPIVSLTIRGGAGQEAAIETLLDTGYNGSMSFTLGHRVVIEMVDGGTVSVERL